MSEAGFAVGRVMRVRRSTPAGRAVLAAITGIDACGKGFLAARVAAGLEDRGLRTALLGVDDWLRLPTERFDRSRLAAHFYEHALRLGEMFERLVLPLRDRRTYAVDADLAEETATAYRRHSYCFENIDVVILEGIFLLKQAYRSAFDISFWVDCTFATALERALARRQETLTRSDTIVAYETIYFPVQRIHFRRDNPRAAASSALVNDPRLQRSLVGT